MNTSYFVEMTTVSMKSPGFGSLIGSRSRIILTVSIPLMTLPNTECRPSRWGVGARVTKN